MLQRVNGALSFTKAHFRNGIGHLIARFACMSSNMLAGEAKDRPAPDTKATSTGNETKVCVSSGLQGNDAKGISAVGSPANASQRRQLVNKRKP